MTAIDPRRFRTAAGQFPTGVTVITTLDSDREPSGLTANSFSSLSLHPPMVLFCLGLDSTSLPAFEAGNGFAVHILAADQQWMAQQFATKGIDRWQGVVWEPGYNELPVIADALAVFECRVAHIHPGGDHLIYVGEVERLTVAETGRAALSYFRSRYVPVPDPD